MGFHGTQNYGEAKPSASELGREKRVEVDMQTHELLFVNDYGLKIFGDDIVGQQCWKTLQAIDGPCPFFNASLYHHFL